VKNFHVNSALKKPPIKRRLYPVKNNRKNNISANTAILLYFLNISKTLYGFRNTLFKEAIPL